MSDPLRIGIIGAGRIGQLHAEHLALRVRNAKPMVVADVLIEAARKCAATCGISEAVQDYHAILENPAIDAVLICSATDTHAQIIEEAAAAGKHVFCEKPIAHTLDQIDTALAAVERAGVTLQIGFNRRFDANYRRIREAVNAGEIGQPHRLHLISRDPAPPSPEYVARSGGIFLDMTIHDFDMARFLLASEVEEVYAMGGVLIDPAIGTAGDLDTAVVMLRFANGVIGTIDNSRKAVYGYDQRAEVFGSGGAISTSNNHPNTAVLSTASSVRHDLPLNFFMERYVDSYITEIQAFVNAILEGTAPPVSGVDGRAPVVIALATRRSFDEHRPVRIDEIG